MQCFNLPMPWLFTLSSLKSIIKTLLFSLLILKVQTNSIKKHIHLKVFSFKVNFPWLLFHLMSFNPYQSILWSTLNKNSTVNHGKPSFWNQFSNFVQWEQNIWTKLHFMWILQLHKEFQNLPFKRLNCFNSCKTDLCLSLYKKDLKILLIKTQILRKKIWK